MERGLNYGSNKNVFSLEVALPTQVVFTTRPLQFALAVRVDDDFKYCHGFFFSIIDSVSKSLLMIEIVSS